MTIDARTSLISHPQSLIDALFFSLMVGIGESYFAAFALAKGFSEVTAGLMMTVPLVLGAVVPVLFFHKAGRLRSLKRRVLWSAGFQASILLAMAVVSVFKAPPVTLVFALATLYFAGGLVAGPAWNFWMGTLIAEGDASRFFSQRLRVTQIGLFGGLLIGGLLLHSQQQSGSSDDMSLRFWVFGILFLCAFVFRMVSVWALGRQRLEEQLQFHESLGLIDSIKVIVRRSGTRKLFSFLFIFYVVIFISSPFVTPFFLAELRFDYQKYMWALAALMIGKATILPWGANWIHRSGVKVVLQTGAIGIAPLPAVWAFTKSFESALMLQFVSGIFWGLFELAFSVIFFSHLRSIEKIPLLTLYNFFNAAAILIGSLAGAWILSSMGSQAAGYDFMFILGAIMRILVVIGFWWSAKKVSTFFREGEEV
jgi:MFS family permease